MTALPLHRSRTGAVASLDAILATDRSFPLFLLRIALGLVVLPHGLQKTLGWFGGWGFSGTMEWFAGIGVPAVLGFLAIVADSAGAVALIAGAATRVAAFGIGVNMLVATLLIHRTNGFFMNWAGNQAGEGFEFHILAFAMALALLLGGAGRWSLDRLFARGR
jgi:putative oxidoreductase